MFAGASLDENSGAFCELKANFFRLILTKAELLALNPKDVDLEKRTIAITKSYQRLGKKDVITPPKTSKSKRVITIPEFLAADIKDYIDSLYELRENDRLFPITKYYLEHEMQRGIKESWSKADKSTRFETPVCQAHDKKFITFLKFFGQPHSCP